MDTIRAVREEPDPWDRVRRCTALIAVYTDALTRLAAIRAQAVTELRAQGFTLTDIAAVGQCNRFDLVAETEKAPPGEQRGLP